MEVLVATGIFILIVAGAVEIMIYSFHSRDIIWEQLSTQNESRRALQDFTNELRTAAASSIGAYAIESSATSSFVFYANIDADSWRERVRYFLSNGVLRKGVTKPSGSPLSYPSGNEVVVDLVRDVANTSTPLFTYYGQNYNGTTATSALPYPVNVTDIRVVGVSLYVEENPRLAPAPLLMETKVSARNLKSN